MDWESIIKIFVYVIGVIALFTMGVICYFFMIISSWFDTEDYNERDNGKNRTIQRVI